MMAAKEENRIFVGGLSRDITERQLQHAFLPYGKILQCQIMMDRDTGRTRGFGFITFADRRGMEDAIKEMHEQEVGDRIVSVNKAHPRMGGDDADQGYRGGSYPSSAGISYGGGDRVGQDDCFKCWRKGHFVRDCPLAGSGRGRDGISFSSRPTFGGASGNGNCLSGESDRYAGDRYGGGRYGDKDRFDNGDYKYGARDRYLSDRYPTNGDPFASDRFGGGGSDYPQNGYGKERGYDRYNGPRGIADDRYGSEMQGRDKGRNNRARPGPYDRPSRGGRLSSYDPY